ncbi:TVP38/TMEM64 family protein [Tanticharoenia sakaeratensis]|uniref:TVP38/TMEM64 family membrane protein n=1 Tax=Tanticharoenia sakaeratensis NBRC 103193 TaxID=1231623 RepID=A0A0D6MN43_9PROT|nr:VTT domain-containing protein [Tanticharoenia sakaeratensis]GAN54856.1 hypothetical protein Tasa_031_074 [Tanticharoenia sakaeratensis NBRC 103193]GBQ21360.1 hypothetical protein AA103193_1700 [Tanticharoenia sakaeratensis NBRC 103193]
MTSGSDPVAPLPPTRARLWRPLALIIVLAGLAWGVRFLPGVRHWIELAEAGHLPMGWLLAGGILYCALGLPRQALSLACGLTCGTAIGMIVVSIATVLGSAIAYGAAAFGIRPRHGTGRIGALRARLAARPFRAVLTLRLMPVGSAFLVNIASGAARIGFWPFVAATLIGSAPQSLIFVLLGAGTRIGQTTQLALAAALAVASLGLGMALMRGEERKS